jgi:hypothetical protein
MFIAPIPIDKNNIVIHPDCKKFTAPSETGSRFVHSAVRAVCIVRSLLIGNNVGLGSSTGQGVGGI